jgi:hypothetical protein
MFLQAGNGAENTNEKSRQCFTCSGRFVGLGFSVHLTKPRDLSEHVKYTIQRLCRFIFSVCEQNEVFDHKGGVW